MSRVTGKSNGGAVDTSTWLTVAAASDFMGCSENTVRGWIRQERLVPAKVSRPHPSGGTREIQVINPSDLARMPRRRAGPIAGDMGEISARAFELYDEGDSVRRVVVALRIEPDLAAALREQWLECGGADLVVSPRARTELEALVGAFDGIAELVERVRVRAGFPVGRVVLAPAVDPVTRCPVTTRGEIWWPPAPDAAARPSPDHIWVQMDNAHYTSGWRHPSDLVVDAADGAPLDDAVADDAATNGSG
jgi:hypothetical protein